ncbi:hypothetical protein D1007_20660 [Hordeum vulgare]|nr:hypothetical protein D1007_20660 [Hordeum vulgare]
MTNFHALMEIEANDFPLELWHDDGVKYIFAHLGSVFSLDQYCVSACDFVSVRAMVMVTHNMCLPPSMVILLPGQELITVSLLQLAFHAHGIGPDDPSPFSSNDDSDTNSNDSHVCAVRGAVLRDFMQRARGRGPPLPQWLLVEPSW